MVDFCGGVSVFDFLLCIFCGELFVIFCWGFSVLNILWCIFCDGISALNLIVNKITPHNVFSDCLWSR